MQRDQNFSVFAGSSQHKAQEVAIIHRFLDLDHIGTQSRI